MTASYEIGGLAEFISDLVDAPQQLEREAFEALDQAGDRIDATAKRIVRRDTGRLQRSIGHSVVRRAAGSGVRLIAGPGLGTSRDVPPYAGFVHDGTSRMSPNPFMANAVKKHTGRRSKLVRQLADIAEDTFA